MLVRSKQLYINLQRADMPVLSFLCVGFHGNIIDTFDIEAFDCDE